MFTHADAQSIVWPEKKLTMQISFLVKCDCELYSHTIQELKLKDKECERLSQVRNQLEQELEELTASLFEVSENHCSPTDCCNLDTWTLIVSDEEVVF